MIIPVILAGGSGTRLWPLSRKYFPKQFFPLVNSRTLLQETCLRLAQAEETSRPLVVCSEAHRFMVVEQLDQAGVRPRGIILEPQGRNTAPAVALAAHFAQTYDPDAVLLVLPTDHHIEQIKPLGQAIKLAQTAAYQGRLATFGIVPSYAETGYGYIWRGEPLKFLGNGGQAFSIRQFVEKPDSATAQAYLADDSYYWNSGMFMFRAGVYLDELQRVQTGIAEACRTAMAHGQSDLDFFRPDCDAFTPSPSISIDYALMEKTDLGAVIPLVAGWNDLGSWQALWSIKSKDTAQNVVIGDVMHKDVHGCYLHATGRLLAVVGLSNHVVVETPDAVMVAPSERSQDVKLLVEAVKEPTPT